MGAFGVGIFAAAAYALYRDLVSARAFQWGFVIAVAVGVSCLPLAWRLLVNRPRRRDQGLFGPGFLCIGGAIFLFGGAVKAVSDFPDGLLHLLGAGVSAYACFALARDRVKQRGRAARTMMMESLQKE